MSNPFYFYDSTNIDYILLLRIDIKPARERHDMSAVWEGNEYQMWKRVM